MNVVIGAQFF
jgi:hypothetical protein